MSEKVKTIPTEKLVEFLSRKIEGPALNQFKNKVDWEAIHIVGQNMLHNDEEIRFCAFIGVKGTEEPAMMWLTIPVAEFNDLPVITVEGVS